MTKLYLKMMRKGKNSKDISLQSIKKTLSKNNVAYVLITCGEPTEDGKMEVEMSYDGDECLAAYLIESAQNVFDNQVEQTIDSHS